ncbi:MAG: MgtC/SapB family protein [Lachnospiraceae bacterium]|nr:MgtC/SapB family protein [Lachnospiraceae bacterium]
MEALFNELIQNSFFIYAVRIILAGICGFSIGLERYINNKSAGVRTHVVVCCASALFMIVSVHGFEDLAYSLTGVRDADPSRIAAQVVTGISFLGAGMIFKDGDAIKGLTTAAGIWSTAAIGLAIGGGMYLISIFVTAFLIIFMIIVSRSRLVKRNEAAIDYNLKITVAKGVDFYPVIDEKVKSLNAQTSNMKIKKNDDGTVTYRFNLHLSEEHHTKEMAEFMKEHEEIKDISANTK